MPRRIVALLFLAIGLCACSQDGKRYSGDPVKALRLTKAYVLENPSYEGEQALSSLSVGRIDLGKKLFHDKRLSQSGNLACATCHIPDQGYTQNDRALPEGATAATGGRNAPSLYDALLRKTLFHDGRAESLERQAIGPLLHPREMANSSMEALAERVRSMKDYDRFFAYAFGGPADPERITASLSAYQRTLVTGPSPFDRWKYQNKTKALTNQQIAGYRLFTGKAGCFSCHLIGEESAPLTDERFHNTGYSATKPAEIASLDTGRFMVTDKPSDRFAFRTPSLRNIALTAPYMHDGRLKSLEDVVLFFNNSANLDLQETDRADLVAFLNALTSVRLP